MFEANIIEENIFCSLPIISLIFFQLKQPVNIILIHIEFREVLPPPKKKKKRKEKKRNPVIVVLVRVCEFDEPRVTWQRKGVGCLCIVE
jgi:hypothetical protein